MTNYINETINNKYLFFDNNNNYLVDNGVKEIFYENAKEKDSLYRFNASSATCYGKEYENVIMGFTGQFHDSDCYTFIIQFIIVSLMYVNVGRGKYWLLLFLASLAGICGAIVENTTLAVICQKKYANANGSIENVYSFLINEIFWITNEYSIPLLNLIKMQAFSDEKLTKWMRYIILFLVLPFIGFRFLIGYNRMTRGYLLDSDIRAFHAGAFGVMAAADMLCTVSILYFVRKKNNDGIILQGQGNNIKSHVKRSSYTILIIVDVVSLILCVLELITDTGPLKDMISTEFVIPFHCLKNSFALILAADAVIFKYGVNAEYINSSGGGGGRSDSYSYQRSGRKYSNYSYSISNDNTYNNDASPSTSSNSITKNKYNEPMATISPYNYPTFDMESYSKSPGKNKTIIKNFTNIKTQTIVDDLSNNVMNNLDYQHNQTFGFLNK